MASEGPQGPFPVSSKLHEPDCEDFLRVLVVGDAASGKTALLQLLQQHAAELMSACMAQEEEGEAGAAAVCFATPAVGAAEEALSLPPLSEEDCGLEASSPLTALQGYRSTCGANVVLLRCTDTSGQTQMVEFWEVGGSAATRATRALLYATPFDGVWLAYDCGNESQFRSLPCWLLEICMRAGTRPSQVFFQQQKQKHRQQHQQQHQHFFKEDAVESPNDMEMQALGSSFWGWRLRCGLCPVLVVVTKADRGPNGGPPTWAPQRRLWKLPECIWRDPSKFARMVGRYHAVEQKVWQAGYTPGEREQMKQLVCSLLNNADCMETVSFSADAAAAAAARSRFSKNNLIGLSSADLRLSCKQKVDPA
ncbi:hypothetical protein Emag_000960 [Eimeria magna]